MSQRGIALALMTLALAGCGGEQQTPVEAVARCIACHSFDKDGPRRTGPNLHGIVGKAAASQPGFSFSPALKASRITWNAETLDAFIANPGKVIPGNRMGHAGEADVTKRQAIIAYMRANGANEASSIP